MRAILREWALWVCRNPALDLQAGGEAGGKLAAKALKAAGGCRMALGVAFNGPVSHFSPRPLRGLHSPARASPCYVELVSLPSPPANGHCAVASLTQLLLLKYIEKEVIHLHILMLRDNRNHKFKRKLTKIISDLWFVLHLFSDSLVMHNNAYPYVNWIARSWQKYIIRNQESTKSLLVCMGSFNLTRNRGWP